jgi:hypothetical protein
MGARGQGPLVGAGILSELGIAGYHQGKAKEFYTKALAADPDLAQAWKNIAELHMWADEKEEAESYYDKYLKREGGDVGVIQRPSSSTRSTRTPFSTRCTPWRTSNATTRPWWSWTS